MDGFTKSINQLPEKRERLVLQIQFLLDQRAKLQRLEPEPIALPSLDQILTLDQVRNDPKRRRLGQTGASTDMFQAKWAASLEEGFKDIQTSLDSLDRVLTLSSPIMFMFDCMKPRSTLSARIIRRGRSLSQELLGGSFNFVRPREAGARVHHDLRGRPAFAVPEAGVRSTPPAKCATAWFTGPTTCTPAVTPPAVPVSNEHPALCSSCLPSPALTLPLPAPSEPERSSPLRLVNAERPPA